MRVLLDTHVLLWECADPERIPSVVRELLQRAETEAVWSVVGYCKVAQGTIGAQIGGQKYYELIFFQNDSTLSTFKEGSMEFSAQASAVAAAEGAATNADYEHGVAVFTKPRSGLMAEASIGGQKFSYQPKVTPKETQKPTEDQEKKQAK